MARRLVSLTDSDIDVLYLLAGDGFCNRPEMSKEIAKVRDKLKGSQVQIKRASAKGKGRAFQQYICKWLSELLDVPYKQDDDDCLIHSREMGQHGTDIILRGTARERFPFDIEAKAAKSLSLQSAVEQADSNAAEGRFGAVFYRQTTQKPLVIFSLDTFTKLCGRVCGNK